MKKEATMDGEPVTFYDHTPIRITCCDCGLTHLAIPEVNDQRVILRYFRDVYGTRKYRKDYKYDFVSQIKVKK